MGAHEKPATGYDKACLRKLAAARERPRFCLPASTVLIYVVTVNLRTSSGASPRRLEDEGDAVLKEPDIERLFFGVDGRCTGGAGLQPGCATVATHVKLASRLVALCRRRQSSLGHGMLWPTVPLRSHPVELL
jgi:hypothetical protein